MGGKYPHQKYIGEGGEEMSIYRYQFIPTWTLYKNKFVKFVNWTVPTADERILVIKFFENTNLSVCHLFQSN